jgi:hypothetical protein
VNRHPEKRATLWAKAKEAPEQDAVKESTKRVRPFSSFYISTGRTHAARQASVPVCSLAVSQRAALAFDDLSKGR